MSLWNVPAGWDYTATSDQSSPLTTNEDHPSLQGSDRISIFPSTTDNAYSSGAISTPPIKWTFEANSHLNTPVDGSSDSNAFISVSTAFSSTVNSDERQSDLIIISSDSVLFYVHSGQLLAESSNGFNGHLPLTPRANTSDNDLIIALPERSTVINLLLLAVYRMPCVQYMPSFEDLSETAGALNTYGLPIESYLSPSLHLFDALLAHAPTRPLDLYAFAASRGLHELAVNTSPHLLSFTLSSLTDEMATKIGPVYLKKLFFLHLGRTDALKQLLQSPPRPHAPTPSCGFEEQKELTRAWALASAYLTWNARPDIGASTIDAELRNLADHLSCEVCKLSLRDRVHDLVVQWSTVGRTII